MFRKLALAVAVLVLAACSNCTSKCTEGVTFYVDDIAGSLTAKDKIDVTICWDGDCQVTTVTHSQLGNGAFLPFKGVGSGKDHTITVSGTGLKGSYTGPVDHITGKATGSSCSSGCAVAAVKIGADGSVTPGTFGTTTTTAKP